MSILKKQAFLLLALHMFARLAVAHDHHDENIPKGSAISDEPIDAILWIHIFMMIITFGIIFPTGMVLGMTRSRWHVPVQIVGTCLAIVGWFLGHAHKGRQFAPNIHSYFASTLMGMLAKQVAIGVYLKLHLEKGFHGKIRWFFVRLHGITGKLMPIVAWTQMLFGAVTAAGICRGDHLGQCVSHFALGSSLIAYGIIMNIFLLAGRQWLKRRQKTQEFWDSLVIAVWGFFITFTGHWWGSEWTGSDIQFTATGLLWWCAGMVGLWLSFGPDRGPRRNIIPALVIFLTGFAMSSWHPKEDNVSTVVYSAFGYSLMAAGLARVVEITFLLKDRVSLPRGGISSFQYLPSFFLFSSGFIFHGATEEQLGLLRASKFDEVSYLLLMFSVSFLVFLLSLVLINMYVRNRPGPSSKRARAVPSIRITHDEERARRSEDRQIADANEFELEELVSEEEEEARRLVPVTHDSEGLKGGPSRS
ncbi:hypothetical protein BJ508DRAFT_410695 [Ascobolus immersus RN42]|uniref:Integral membrane protein n=1 Tax=Ascobolus immersus RN42 TaxID=1160509 RepID=A0A3N4INY2_ASCIM|nr:hypothetical protein BJ508DRAFT_410695 [Ascobolus immersus RN42]